MPCRMPPSTWLRAPIGLTTRPMSCTATTRSTVIRPVRVSTATCAIWQPNVFTAMPSGLGARDPDPVTHALPSFWVTSWMGRRRVPSVDRTSPSVSSRSEAAISNMSAASSSSCVRTWWPADRTAGATDASVIEPPENGPCPARSVSPVRTVTWSGRIPSRSASTTAQAVVTPVPRSCMPTVSTGLASLPIRTSA